MKITDAYVCLTCDEVFEPYTEVDVDGKRIKKSYACPACTGLAYPIHKWLAPAMAERSAA